MTTFNKAFNKDRDAEWQAAMEDLGPVQASDPEVRSSLLSEVIRKFMEDALVAIAGAVCTPEKGYAEDGGLQLLLSDIKRLRKQHDELQHRLAQAGGHERTPREVAIEQELNLYEVSSPDAERYLLSIIDALRTALAEERERRERAERALAELADAADAYAADQYGATDERCGLVQPISVEEGEALNAALSQAYSILKDELRTQGQGADIEKLAERVHQAYLDTCKRLEWPVKPSNQVPYSELSEDSKELDRASVRAVLFATHAPTARDGEGRREAADKQSYDDLAASGGIVDAP